MWDILEWFDTSSGLYASCVKGSWETFSLTDFSYLFPYFQFNTNQGDPVHLIPSRSMWRNGTIDLFYSAILFFKSNTVS